MANSLTEFVSQCEVASYPLIPSFSFLEIAHMQPKHVDQFYAQWLKRRGLYVGCAISGSR
jgi:hypothetical protein